MLGMKFTNSKDLDFDVLMPGIVDAWFSSNTPDDIVRIFETASGDFDLWIGRQQFAAFETFEDAKRHAECFVTVEITAEDLGVSPI